MKTYDLTIIVPVYNSEKTIERTLYNLLFFASKGIKVIISDNFSSDRTREILKKFGSLPNFSIHLQDRNMGINSFHFLLRNVTTTWVLPIGADDYLVTRDNFISELEKFFSKSGFIGMALRSRFIYSDGLVDDHANVALVGSESRRFAKFLFFNGCNSRYYGVIRSDLMRKYYPTQDYFGSDVVLTAKILLHGNWDYCKTCELHREKGISSTPLRLRAAYGYKGIGAILPPTRFLFELFNLNRRKSVVVYLAAVLLYVRYCYGPIKYLIGKK